MKVFQCVHHYPPYTSYFEDIYKKNIKDLSFNELRNLLINDGYASAYILKPAFDGKFDEVFYTIWDYETLQFKWAEENGLKSRNLDEIKLAQIEEYKPDIFYNHSPYYDRDFVHRIKHKKNIKKICWDAVIVSYPSFHENYDLRFTLFEPFVSYWKRNGYNAYLLPPAFAPAWENLDQTRKDIDILFYGQYADYIFSNRNNLLQELVKWTNRKGLKFALHLQYSLKRKSLINIRGVRRFTRWIPSPPSIITKNSLPPIYGKSLYETISRSKIVINAFGNYNGLFKDNMRNYESIGCGAVLIGEDGIYPEHYISDKDFYTYRSVADLLEKIEQVLSLPDQGFEIAKSAKEKLKSFYSKENQWECFVNATKSL